MDAEGFQRWIIIGGEVFIVVLILKRSNWRKIFKFLKRETIETLEQKLYSFDEGINATIITDEQGVVTNVNQACEVLFGIKEAEWIGTNIDRILRGKTKEYHQKWIKDAFGKVIADRTFYMDASKSNGFDLPIEMVIRKRIIHARSFYVIIIVDRSRDMEKSRKYERLIELLKEGKAIVDKGEEVGSFGSWFWDLRTNKITASEGYKKMIGLDVRGDYEITEIKPRIWQDDKEIVNDAIEKAFNGEGYDITYRFIRSTDLNVLTMRSITQVLKDKDDLTIGIYGSTRLVKISSLKEASNERQ